MPFGQSERRFPTVHVSVVYEGEGCEKKQNTPGVVQRGQEAWGQGHGSLHAMRQLRIGLSFIYWRKYVPQENLSLPPARPEGQVTGVPRTVALLLLR